MNTHIILLSFCNLNKDRHQLVELVQSNDLQESFFLSRIWSNFLPYFRPGQRGWRSQSGYPPSCPSRTDRKESACSPLLGRKNCYWKARETFYWGEVSDIKCCRGEGTLLGRKLAPRKTVSFRVVLSFHDSSMPSLGEWFAHSLIDISPNNQTHDFNREQKVRRKLRLLQCFLLHQSRI